MVNAGFGGAEVVPVSIAGGDGEGVLDWGSEHWKEVTKHMLEVAGENNFTIDFTMTPAWPLALPTIKDVDDPAQGAQMELDGAWTDGITKENPFDGTLPVSAEADDDSAKVNGTVVLTGVSVAKYADKENKVLAYDSAKALDLLNRTTGETKFVHRSGTTISISPLGAVTITAGGASQPASVTIESELAVNINAQSTGQINIHSETGNIMVDSEAGEVQLGKNLAKQFVNNLPNCIVTGAPHAVGNVNVKC